MDTKRKQLIIALVLGAIAIIGHNFYVSSLEEELAPKKFKSVIRVSKQVLAGTAIKKKGLKKVKIPEKYMPKAAIPWEERDTFVGQEISVDVRSGDYLLASYFDTRLAVGERLSKAIEGENVRAISLPVDETNSLSRSILVGDRIDIIFSFSVPMVGAKMSTLLLQNVPVIATGTYSAADQEIGARGGRAKSYSSLTLKLGIEDAMRLNYARQAGKINLMLRNESDTGVVDLAPISGIADLLSAADKSKVETLGRAAGSRVPNENKIKAQMQEVLRLQKQQISKLKK